MFDNAEDKTREDNTFELPRPAGIIGDFNGGGKRDVVNPPEQRKVQGRRDPWPGREKRSR